MAAEAQFRDLFEAHREYLYRLALKLSGDAELAKDLVQDTFCRALLQYGRFEPGTNARAWLAKILTNLYFDHRKHEKVVAKGEAEILITITETADCDPTMTTISDAELYAAIQKLEPELREVIELCYLQQLGYRAAAEQLGVPQGTIGTRLMRARANLKHLLEARRS